MPTLGALVGHETGGVQEYAGLQKVYNSSVDTFANFGIPAPAGVRESYCLKLSEATIVPEAVRTKAFTYDRVGGSARIYLTNDAADPYIDLLRMTNASGSVIHARVRLRTDGKISLIDANGVEQTVSSGTVSGTEWLKLYWKWGRADSGGKLYVWLIDSDGHVATAFESDADFSGGSGDVAVELWGQLGTATVPCNIYLCDLYALYGVTGTLTMSDLVTGGWEVLGPGYQTDHASSAVDAGSGPLDTGLWNAVAETPTGSSRIGYDTAGSWGCRKTDGTTKYGPNGDSRVNGEIKGASWIYTIGLGNVSCYYGHLGDYTLDGGIYTRAQNAQFILDAADSRCPTKTEEFLQGFKCQAGGGRAALTEAWSFLLHVRAAEKRAGLGSINRTAREVLAG